MDDHRKKLIGKRKKNTRVTYSPSLYLALSNFLRARCGNSGLLLEHLQSIHYIIWGFRLSLKPRQEQFLRGGKKIKNSMSDSGGTSDFGFLPLINLPTLVFQTLQILKSYSMNFSYIYCVRVECAPPGQVVS